MLLAVATVVAAISMLGLASLSQPRRRRGPGEQASLMHEISEEPESDAERPLTMLDTLPEAKLPVVISQQQQPAAAVPPPLWEDTELEVEDPRAEVKWLQYLRVGAYLSVLTGVCIWSVIGGDIDKIPYATKLLGRPPPIMKCQARSPTNLLLRYGDLGGLNLPIVTDNPFAQRLFNLGMLQRWNFNEIEALRAFEGALPVANDSAMLHWGVSYVLGPSPNKAFEDELQPFPAFPFENVGPALQAAHRAAESARSTQAAGDSPVLARRELMLADAAVARFAGGRSMQARLAAEETYALKLADLGKAFQDAGLMAMAAESLMNLSPWDYYQADGSLRPNAARAEELLTACLMLDRKQPLGLHLMVHLAEVASPLRNPPNGRPSAARAEAAADLLAQEDGPWSYDMGHLLHMPSHLYVRLGRWHDAVTSSQAAVAVDARDARLCQAAYFPEHNAQMLVYAANMGGEFEEARRQAADLRNFEQRFMRYPMQPGFDWASYILTLVQQGQWKLLVGQLAKPPPRGARGLCADRGEAYVKAVHAFGRAMTLSAKVQGLTDGNESAIPQPGSRLNRNHVLELYVHGVQSAVASLQEQADAMSPEPVAGPGDPPGVYGCDYNHLMRIMAHVAAAREGLLHGDHEAAVGRMENAAAVEDGMGYMEPPRLWQPTRHCLGYVYLLLQRPQDAAKVFQEDLSEYPGNGWSLLGMAQASVNVTAGQQGGQSRDWEAEHAAAWQHADSALASPCLSFSVPFSSRHSALKLV